MALKVTARQIFFVALDVFLFLAFCSSMLVFYRHVQPTRRGFFCSDTSIRKPFLESSVPAAIAASVGITINIVLITVVETVKYTRRNKEDNAFSIVSRTPVNIGRARLCDCPLLLLRRILGMVFVFMFGAAVTGFFTDVMKYSLGRLRPHFLDICNPDWSSFNCTDQMGLPVFVTDYQCRGTDLFKLKDARLSFPSGHSSFSAYSMLMAMLFIAHEVRAPEHSKFLKPVLQLVFLGLGLFTGLSRIADYKHHWSDVLAGFLLGGFVAFVFDYFFMTRDKAKRRPRPHQNGGTKRPETNDNNKLFAQETV